MCAKARVVRRAFREVAVVATDSVSKSFRVIRHLAALIGGVLAAVGARAADLPEDNAEALFHSYNGGGVSANGPALLVRKRLADKVSLSASYYVDAVSNASIDVVTTASPYREQRNEYGLGMDYVYRDSKISLAANTSRESDYTANRFGLDIAQETFGGMTSISMGFTRGDDQIGKSNAPEFADTATHWQYRLGATQILSPRWIMSANAEVLSDDGFLGSPYRIARVFGAAVPEKTPRTRSGRALKFRLIGDLNARDALHLDYRYYWDTWDIKANTAEAGYSRHFGEQWLADASLRYYAQTKALFYSDNASTETTYISRNRQLSTFNSVGLGAKVAYTWRRAPGKFDIKLNAALETTRFQFSDFTDIRTGELYAYQANVLQLYLSANF
ncbi:MAG: DUF3570 domain-containing protein [Rhodoferax sp.]|nr:DUF3570 domain-containing protein [Rhodoferax sp.]